MSTTAKQIEVEKTETGGDLPEGWAEALLTETSAEAKFSIVDGPFGSDLKLSDYVAGGAVPVLTTRNLTGTYDPASVRFISQGKFRQLQRSKVTGGDILIAKIGSVGKCSIYPEGAPAAIIPANLCKITVNPAVVYNRFLYWQIRSEEFQQKLIGITSATAQPAFSVQRLKTLSAKAAPCAEQHRIVKMIEQSLRQVDGATNRLSNVKRTLKHFRQAALAAACSGKLTEDWRKQNPKIESAKKLLERLVVKRTKAKRFLKNTGDPEETYDLPPSWAWAIFDDTCTDITVGHVGPMIHEYLTNGIPFLRSQNIREFRFEPAGLKFVSQAFHRRLAKSALHPGDVAVVRSGYPGVSCVIPDSLPKANCADLVVVRPSGALDSHYACIFINSSFARTYVESEKVGIAQGHFNVGSMRKTPLPFPPLEEQHGIVRRVDALFKLADAIEKRVAAATLRADRLTQAILAKAFRGELVPTEAELARREGREYEPAAVLLERIKKERERAAAMKAERAQRTSSLGPTS
jgi:type I restriction enzyme, S subunit